MNMPQQHPVIVGFVSDLMFTTRIAAVAQKAGYQMQWVENASEIAPEDNPSVKEPPGEMLHGRAGQLFAKITAWQPALLLFDLNSQAFPWQKWIPALKSSPATRRIPILCFGPHEEVAVMNEARRVGADAVLARSRFTSDMAGLFQKYARIPDYDALSVACAEPLSALARRGIELFNTGEYYKCHDDLEAAWMADSGAGRDLYRGILQVGIALYQVQRGNYRGAVKMLLRVRQWLDPLPAVCRGVNVAGLRTNAQQIHAHVQALGTENLADFDWSIVHQIECVEE